MILQSTYKIVQQKIIFIVQVYFKKPQQTQIQNQKTPHMIKFLECIYF